jgi:Lar family restriction alleviation protein
MPDELKPCPFCGRTELLGFEPYPESGFIGVRCRYCGCIGPAKLSETEKEAAAHWNERV